MFYNTRKYYLTSTNVWANMLSQKIRLQSKHVLIHNFSAWWLHPVQEVGEGRGGEFVTRIARSFFNEIK